MEATLHPSTKTHSISHNGADKAHSVHELLAPQDTFVRRHIGPDADEIATMLATIGVGTLDALIDATVPASIRLQRPLQMAGPRAESEVLADLKAIASKNRLYRSYLGMGYYDTLTPGVILRNIVENPGWYTAYTPYQPEIAQGRLEALLNFQTMVSDLTGLDIANASMLDEATAAAEAMTMCKRAQKRGNDANVFFVSDKCHPQTIAVVQGRAVPLGYDVVVGDAASYDFSQLTFGVLVQYPDTEGNITAWHDFAEQAHAANAFVVVATDLLALTLLTPPGEFGADIAIGSSQRFGVPLGYGGPHAAFMATRDDLKRIMPGRLVGVSVDSAGNPALRLSLQTREQHIRRDKATSNICTAQVLLAIVASMYAVYHGPAGLRRIAQRVRLLTATTAHLLRKNGYTVNDGPTFDTLKIRGGALSQTALLEAATAARVNLRAYADGAVGVAMDETTTVEAVRELLAIFGVSDGAALTDVAASIDADYDATFARTSDYLTHPVFNQYHTETEMLRYIFRLQSRDLSLAQAMIPLGSCTMKLNATTEMIPVTWPEFGKLHPFVPRDQAAGYTELFTRLEAALAEVTGFAAVSLQPNAGSQGEYAGLLAIRAYHLSRGDEHRRVCLIPSSAHGTNPASAVMAGMDVVVVACDERGNVDLDDLRAKAAKHSENLAAIMVTYPSTHGVFEEGVVELCRIVHEHGGQVYMDGANMNAQVGLCRPGDIGADVCHLNLHKTFCIPHGGGGPGMGPIGVAAHLTPFLPGHPVVDGVGGDQAAATISAAPWGSPSILPISYAYIAMMGGTGLTEATKVAILNANYIAARLQPHYPVLYRGDNGFVAHECIVDVRPLKAAGIEVDDIAKRLMDYGFHAPTMSFPVPGTLMIEPTESESLVEIDRFCDAMIAIREEIRDVEIGAADPEHNLLKGAPHTAQAVVADGWDRPYSREDAAFPTAFSREAKFWPAVGRIDSVFGDRHLVCICPPIEAYA